MKKLFILSVLLFIPMAVSAQSGPVADLVFPLDRNPEHSLKHDLYGFWSNGKTVYNLNSGKVATFKGKINDFAISPDGESVAVLISNGSNTLAGVRHIRKTDENPVYIKAESDLVAITWTESPTIFAAADINGIIHKYDISTINGKKSKGIKEKTFLNTGIQSISHLLMTDGICAVANNREVVLYDLSTKTETGRIGTTADIKSLKYNNSSKTVCVLTADGYMTAYNTYNMLPEYSVESLGETTDFDIHPDDKYIAVITGNDRLAIVNTKDDTDRRYYDTMHESINRVWFVKKDDGSNLVMYNTPDSFVYMQIGDGIQPNYGKLISEEIDEKMAVWMQRMPGESLSDYNARVNEAGIQEQRRLFEEEIATRMAGNMLECAEISLDGFNPSSGILSLEISNMPPVYLPVPQADLATMEVNDLEFMNAKYGITPEDKFELVYLDVYNPKTGSTYTFDNRQRESLDYMLADNGFIPVDLIKKTDMEEIRLQDIRQNVMNMALRNNTISNHTDINVTSEIYKGKNDSGEQVMNYKIGFEYKVKKGFSKLEDFAPGEFKTGKSGAAMSMCSIIKKTFETDFAPYLAPGKKVIVTITGMADVLPINKAIPYDGCYGDPISSEISSDSVQYISVNSKDGIKDNVQLAFMRAAGLKDNISENISGFAVMDIEYRYIIKVADQTGGEHRRISVDFDFIDAM